MIQTCFESTGWFRYVPKSIGTGWEKRLVHIIHCNDSYVGSEVGSSEVTAHIVSTQIPIISSICNFSLT